MDNKRNRRQHHALTARVANSTLGCTSRSVASRWRKVITPLYSTCVRSYLEQLFGVVSPAPTAKTLIKWTVCSTRPSRWPRRLEHRPCKKQLRLLQLEKATTGEGTKKTEPDTSQQCTAGSRDNKDQNKRGSACM